CSHPLRTPKARQCFACGTDWHDPLQVRKLCAGQGKDVIALLKCLEDPELRAGLADPARAPGYEEQALAIYRAVHGDDQPGRAASLHDLARLLVSLGNEARGRPYFETALAIRREVLGEDHPDTAEPLNVSAHRFQMVELWQFVDRNRGLTETY